MLLDSRVDKIKLPFLKVLLFTVLPVFLAFPILLAMQAQPSQALTTTTNIDLFQGAPAFSTKRHNNTAFPPAMAVDGIDASYAHVGGQYQQIDLWVDLGNPR